MTIAARRARIRARNFASFAAPYVLVAITILGCMYAGSRVASIGAKLARAWL